MSLLGLGERHIIFLGYGDLTLPQLYDSTSSTTVFTSGAGQSQTYASRGLGGTDYHNYLHRVHGAYNRTSLLGDVEAVLQTFKPEEIYTTNSWDAHPDHQATLLFIVEAMQDLRNRGMNFFPKAIRKHHPCSKRWLWPGGEFLARAAIHPALAVRCSARPGRNPARLE